MSRQKIILILIFTVAMLLRLVLGILNREANDNHAEVVTLIVSTHKIPDKSNCDLCYHPKLFYLVSAAVAEGLNIKEYYATVKVMQLINVLCSFFILWLFWRFIDDQQLNDDNKLIVFAFFAFNPCLTGINVQSTNDTFVIFFGVLTVFLYRRVFGSMKLGDVLLITLVLLLGMLSKASAFVLVAITSVAFIIKFLAETRVADKMQTAKYLLVILITIATIVPFAGGYYHNYKKFGSYTLSTWQKDPPPLLFSNTFVTRAGVRSVAEGFFTFRYFDMIHQPYDNNEWNNYPVHRTSLWSQLYGRTMFLHFEQWPYDWQSQDALIINIGRVLILLGIVPLILLLAGLFINGRRFIEKLLNRDRSYFAMPVNYIYFVTVMAFLFSSVYYSYHFRDFSAMKSIYIFPGLLAFIKMFMDGFGILKDKRVMLFAQVVIIVVIVFSIADILFLVKQLS